MFALVDHAIDRAAVLAAVSDPGFGAVLVFEGVGRNHFEGRAVVGLEYEAYEAMAVPEMQKIGQEAMQRFGAKVAIVHRTGRVAIGEPSVIIATGTAHRAACYEANRYCIDELKKRVTVWKKELYEEGGAWKANAEQDL